MPSEQCFAFFVTPTLFAKYSTKAGSTDLNDYGKSNENFSSSGFVNWDPNVAFSKKEKKVVSLLEVI